MILSALVTLRIQYTANKNIGWLSSLSLSVRKYYSKFQSLYMADNSKTKYTWQLSYEVKIN